MKNTFLLLLFSVILLYFQINVYGQNVGSAAYIDVNNIYLPFNRDGDIAAVNIPPAGSGGNYLNEGFLFSGGFYLCGIMDSVWANGVFHNIILKDYQSGTVDIAPNDPRSAIYKLRSDDPVFGASWQAWSDAVDLGADFYDGNEDGVYNPIDLNGNNQWDPDEDMPDILGDETYWCVYNDGVPSEARRWPMNPLGIEIRQTIFAFETDQLPLSNTIFIRYKILNRGTVVSNLEDVIFGHPYDPDIGNLTENLGGTDISKNASYCYGDSTCFQSGMTPLTFLADFISGPVSYIPGVSYIDYNLNNSYENGIDIPLDTAFIFAGQLGVHVYVGATNLRIKAGVTYADGDIFQGEPRNPPEVRNYLMGLQRNGNEANPCTYYYGEVRGGVDCNTVSPYYWYSGDPVNNIGWINTLARENHAIFSLKPFDMEANQTKEIIMAYIVGTGNDALSSVNEAKSLSDAIQNFYEDNFGYQIVLSSDEQNAVLNKFTLEQNYPNPFNPSTKIKYQIPSVGTRDRVSVQLKVYDILGNEIVTLLNEELSPGEYEVTFDGHSDGGHDLPSGVYFYQLSIEGPETSSGQAMIQTKKMILMK